MIMQTHPHHQPTLIAILLRWVETWRRAQGMSRQTAAQLIVEAHERIGGPTVTCIEFNPPTRDAYKRMAVNCDRVYRWLDDATKETNHLPANMVPSILAALPLSYRLHALDDILRPHGLAVRLQQTLVEAPAPAHLKGMLRETAEAAAAFTDLLDGATPAELLEAQRQLAEARDAVCQNLALVEGLISKEGQ